MHRLVPDFILQQYKAKQFRGQIQAAALFVDVSGFSTITSALMEHGQHGAEVMSTVMNAILAPLIDTVYAYSGFIAGFAGDAFTALFVEPDFVQSALAAGCLIQKQAQAIAEQPTPYGKFTFGVKVGLGTGLVNWGIPQSGDGRRAAYFFQGPGIDTATAAEKHASQGELVMSAGVYGQAAAAVTAERSGPMYRLTGLNSDLPPAQPASIDAPELGIVAPFLPPPSISTDLTAEFRQVLTIFISLPTVRTESQLDIFMQTVFELLNRYQGHLGRLDFGDKGANLLLFWGAPLAHENDIERGLDFILTLQSSTSIPVHAGVSYGRAHAGFTGSDLRREYTCIGRRVNLAVRLMTAAPRGEIWTDENVARLASETFEFYPEGTQAFKGFAEPKPVHVLYERKAGSERFYPGKLVGREDEKSELRQRLQPLAVGQPGGMVVVLGEAGIGKSRLVQDLVDEIRMPVSGQVRSTSGAAAAVFLCQTDEILREALNPFRYWLMHFFGISKGLAESRNKRSFNRRLDRLIADTDDQTLARELDRTRSVLAALVGLRWPDSLYETLDGEGRYENTQTGLSALIRAESLQQPLILVLEDVQWLDSDSHAFLEYFLRSLNVAQAGTLAATPAPVAIVATARTEEPEAAWAGLETYRLQLSQLPAAAVAQLAETRLGGKVSPTLTRLLQARAEGNPFFAEQILRYMEEEKMLSQGEAGWDVDLTGASLLPTHVRAVLIARLDRLTQEVKEVVQTASVLGREFEIRLLSRMLQDDSALTGKLEKAQEASIWAAIGDIRYLFKHQLLRDAAYRMQVHTQRQRLHALALDAMVSLYKADLPNHYGELAYHAERALNTEDACQYLILAAETAAAGYQNSLALGYYARARALLPKAQPEQRLKILLAQEELHHLMGNRQQQAEDLARLEKLAAGVGFSPSQAAEVMLRGARMANTTGNFLAAAAAAEAAAAKAAEADDHAIIAAAMLQRGMALKSVSDFDQAKDNLAKALHLAGAADSPDLEGEALRHLGIIASSQGQVKLAQIHLENALTIFQQARNRKGEGRSLNSLGSLALKHGDMLAAQTCFAQVLGICREIGDRRGEGLSLNNLGVVAGQKGDGLEARRLFSEALAIRREIGDQQGLGHSLNNLGVTAMEQGDLEAARAYYQQALDLQRQIGDRQNEALALVNLGRSAFAQGDWAGARQYQDQALLIARAITDPYLEEYAMHGLGVALVELGDAETATAVLAEVVTRRRASGNRPFLLESLAGLARAQLAIANLPAASEIIEEILASMDDVAHIDHAPFILLTCYQVLHAAKDPAARQILSKAHQILMDRAERFPDEADRRRFIEKNRWHHQISTTSQDLVNGS